MTFFDYLPPLVLAGALLYGVLAQFVPLPGLTRVERGDGPCPASSVVAPHGLRSRGRGRNRKAVGQ